MNIKEIILKKRRLKDNILILLNEFEYDTHVTVSDISISRVSTTCIGEEEQDVISNITINTMIP